MNTSLSERSASVYVVILCFFIIGACQLAAFGMNLFRVAVAGYIFAFVLMFFSGVIRRGDFSFLLSGSVFFLPLYFYALSSASWAPNSAESFRDAGYTIITVYPAFLFGLILSSKCSVRKISYGLCVLVFTFLIQSMVNVYSTGDLMLYEYGSIRSVYGQVACFLIPVLWGSYLAARDGLLILFLLIAIALVLAGASRSALLIVCVSLFFVYYRYDKYKSILIFFLVSVFLLFFVFLSGSSGVGRLNATDTSFDVSEVVLDELHLPPEERVDFDRRLTTYVAIRSFLNNPLFGVGYSGIRQINEGEFGIPISAHGLVPGSLGELGFLGVSFFMLLVGVVFVRYKHALKLSRSASDIFIMRSYMVALLSALLFGMFHQLIESAIFGLLIGLIFGFFRYQSYVFRLRKMWSKDEIN